MQKQLKWVASMAFTLVNLVAIAQSPVKISGQLTMDKYPKVPVKLFKVSQGSLEQIAVSDGNRNGEFGFLFYPEYEGMYVIGLGNEHSATGNFSFYFKPGDHLSLKLNTWDYSLSGTDNSEENRVLYSWHRLTDTIYGKSVNFMHGMSTYVDFFPQLERVAAETNKWLRIQKTGNPKFDSFLPGYTKLEMAMIAINFLQTPRSAHPSVEEYSSFYNSLKAADFTSSTRPLYQYPYGKRVLGQLPFFEVLRSGKELSAGDDMVEIFGQYILNDTLKGDFVLDQAALAKGYDRYKELMDKYGSLILTDSQKVRQVAIRQPLLKFKRGDDAYNFSYEDNHGKTVSLSDMKGKVVLVDVWATWCGPCKAEIPYLKKLEEKMKGQDVQFVSISVDEVKDKKKWLHFIDTAKLGGTQLFAGGWNQKEGLAQYYQIKGIPRFMVFDRNGKIVSVDAPRPSTPELKAMLEEALEK